MCIRVSSPFPSFSVLRWHHIRTQTVGSLEHLCVGSFGAVFVAQISTRCSGARLAQRSEKYLSLKIASAIQGFEVRIKEISVYN